MDRITAKFSVYFEPPFWIGLYEREEDARLCVARVVFGSEPSDAEVWAYLLENFGHLRFTRPVEAGGMKPKAGNPKRMQRAAAKELQTAGTGTKAQQAIKQQIEEHKLERRSRLKRKNEEEKQRQFALRQQKKKEKHRGR